MRWLFLAVCLGGFGTLGCGASATAAVVADGLPPKNEPPDDAERYALSSATTQVEVDINGVVSYTLKFPDVSGELMLAAAQPHQSVANVFINMKSATTDNKELERIAKSEDFLNVEKYPKATFEVRQMTRKADAYEVVGILELHGTTKALTVPFNLAVDDCQALATTEFSIDRRKFGVESDTFLDGMASDAVDIRVRMDIPREAAPNSCGGS